MALFYRLRSHIHIRSGESGVNYSRSLFLHTRVVTYVAHAPITEHVSA